MQTSHSPSATGVSNRVLNHQRLARAAVLNGVPIPALTITVLEAQGINVGELETRLRENMELRR